MENLYLFHIYPTTINLQLKFLFQNLRSFCIICQKEGGKLVVVTDRGKVSLKKFAKLRSDDRVLKDVDQRDDCQVHEN